MRNRNVIEDPSNIAVPSIDWDGMHILNRQSAFNKSAVETCDACGCFHCGSMFSGTHVQEWLPEAHGEDSARCPYCGEDAVVLGGGDYPLSTALLSRLYLHWFKEEFKTRRENATFVPTFKNQEDYLRKGIPFLLEDKADIEIVGEIALFPMRLFDDAWGDLHDDKAFESAEAIADDGSGGIVKVKAYFDDEGYYRAEFVDENGKHHPFEPWTGNQQDLLLELTSRYGDSLRGLIKEVDNEKMQLFIYKR